mmetsp:Transcript_50483/g.68642  ORF Transcript_50483/g.68642 Transcript_50483/m.68642 type:complete len:201 (+) Transcript_50483:1318-1920(+)
MNPGFMSEGVHAHDGLMGLADHPCVVRHHLARGGDVDWVNGRVQGTSPHAPLASELFPAFQGESHDDLLERRVPRAFADAVYRAFNLPGAIESTGEGIGCGETKVVLTVGREDNLVRPWGILAELADESPELPGHVPPSCVGDVQGRRTCLDGRRQNPVKELRVGPASVFGGKFDVITAEGLCEGYSLGGDLHDLIRGLS